MKFLKKALSRLDVRALSNKIDNIQMALGRIEKRQLEQSKPERPVDWEFKVTSQWGEDGIIQMLVSKVPIDNKIFVEFGVENYTESNTRFLLQNNNWSGLVIDGSEENVRYIKNDVIYWRYNLKAHCEFISKDNIDRIFADNGVRGEIGLLSVDIDGNDYWIWESIKSIQPRIIVAEYNSLFGPSAKVSIPYDQSFVRRSNGRPNQYYGVSIAALTHLANKRGYELVAGNSAGNNVFFVKKEFVGQLKVLRPDEAYVRTQFKESRAADGALTFKGFDEAFSEIKDLPVVDVETNAVITIKDISR
jgi:hypothetical protein